MKSGDLTSLPFTHKLGLVAISGALYWGSFELNRLLFDDLLFLHRVHWIYIPAGIRFILVLLLFEVGAVGIFVGALCINYLYYFNGDHLFAIGTSVLAAASPLLARYLSVRWLKMDLNMKGLTNGMLLKMSLLFAILSSCLIQWWFYWNGKTDSFLLAASVMAIGKWLGTVLVLALLRILLKLAPNLISRDKPI